MSHYLGLNIPSHQKHGRKKEGVARESRHFGKDNRLFEIFCECCEFLLV
jgi:hypothetical protein